MGIACLWYMIAADMTGKTDYTVIDIQLSRNATDQEVEEIRNSSGEHTVFLDRRLKNQEAKGAYYSFALFLYGFLVVISMI